jgi:undecaprenyl-diphosphatase
VQEAFGTNRTRLLQVIVGTLPLFPLVLFMKPIKELFNQPQYLGYCFLFTALLLYLGTRVRIPSKVKISSAPRKWGGALFIGIFQAIAILPGISRSGATISAGRLLGWNSQEAATFSFLLAIPAILGGVVLEIMHLLKTDLLNLSQVGLSQYALGFFFSMGVGYVALRGLMLLAAKDKFVYFVWYCLFIGIATLLYFNFFAS